MIPRSFNRVSRSVPPKSLSSTLPRTATSKPESPTHQRRPSSSKASCPPGHERPSEAAANDAAEGSAEKQDASTTSEESKKRPARLPRGRSKDGTSERASLKARGDAFGSMPAVPQTSHLQVQDVHTSAFFSLHRPISITRPIPPSASNKEFNRIFEPRSSPQHRSKDVIYTISRPVPALDGDQQTREEKDLRWEILQNSSSNAEQTRQLQILQQEHQRQTQSLEELVKQFRPFNVPPVPVPFEEEGLQRQIRRQNREQQQSQREHASQEAATSPEAAAGFSASTSAGPEIASTFVFAPLNPRRQLIARFREAQRLSDQGVAVPDIDLEGRQIRTRDDIMHAISVKRQRKLKMKKHKYKKLMRRTRNLRRKEGRN